MFLDHQSRRRCFLARSTSLAVLGVAACTTTTPAVVASVTAAATAAAAAISGIVTDIQGLIATGGFTAAALLALNNQVSALQAQVTLLLTPTVPTAAPAVSSVFTTVTTILTQIGQYLPVVLSIIGALATPTAAPDTPAQASLRAHYTALRVAAGT